MRAIEEGREGLVCVGGTKTEIVFDCKRERERIVCA